MPPAEMAVTISAPAILTSPPCLARPYENIVGYMMDMKKLLATIAHTPIQPGQMVAAVNRTQLIAL